MDICYVISSIHYVRFILACICIAYIPGNSAFIYTPPNNAAAYIGSNVTLNCESNETITSWTFQAAGLTTASYITVSCALQPSLPCSYSVNAAGATECQLIITSATPACSGTYICQDAGGSSTTRSAMVIVLDSPSPYCSANATNNTLVEESTPVSMNCAVSYTTPLLEPQLNWSSPSNSIYSNSSYAYSSVSFVNTIPLLPSGTCNLSFLPPTTFPQLPVTSTPADNAPSYRSSCTVAAIAPVYCPMNINISQSENALTCSAQSNPPASYQWYGPPSGTMISNTPSVDVSDAGNYTCVATNNAAHCSSSMNKTIYSVSTESSTMSTMSTMSLSTGYKTPPVTTSRYSSSVGGIVGGSIAAVVVIVAVVVVIFIWFKRRSKTSEHSDSSTLKSSHSETNIAGLNESQPKNAPHDGVTVVYGRIQMDAHISGPKRRKPVHPFIDNQWAKEIYAIIIQA